MSDHPAPSASPASYPQPSAAPPVHGYPAAPYPAPSSAPSFPAPSFPAPYRQPGPPAPGTPGGAGSRMPRSGTLGTVALLLALAAAVAATAVAAIASVRIGEVAGAAILAGPASEFDWASLAPARGAVLAGEVSFWVGTALGIWALVQGIVAIVQQRGRGQGIAAVVIAALGPAVFSVAVLISISAGAAGPLGL